jgi:hypothetical protein
MPLHKAPSVSVAAVITPALTLPTAGGIVFLPEGQFGCENGDHSTSDFDAGRQVS